MSDLKYTRLQLLLQIERARAEAQHIIVVVLALCVSAVSLMPTEVIRVASVASLSIAAILGTHYVRMSSKTPMERER